MYSVQGFLACDCNEKGGVVTRRVRYMNWNEMPRVYESLQKVPSFVTSWHQFIELVAEGMMCLLVDDVGVFALVFDKPGRAQVHMTFWDKRLRGREQLAKDVAEWVHSAFSVDRIWTAIPKSRPAVIAFAERVGFQRFKEKDDIVGLCYLRPASTQGD